MKRMLVAYFAVAAVFAGVLGLTQSAVAQSIGLECNASSSDSFAKTTVWDDLRGAWVIREFRCTDQGPTNQFAWHPNGGYNWHVFETETKPVGYYESGIYSSGWPIFQTDPLAPVTPHGDLAANTALQQLIGPLSAASDICAAVNALDYADTDDVFRVGATWHYVPAADHDLLPPASRMSAIWGSVSQCAAPAPPADDEGGGQDPPSDEGAGADG